MVEPLPTPSTPALGRLPRNTSLETASDDEQGVPLHVSDNSRGNSDLEIILPDSEDEQLASQSAKQSEGKRKKGKKGKGKRKPIEDFLSKTRSSSMPTNTVDSIMTGRLGQLASAEQLFCPLSAVTKYPYRYLRGDDLDKVANAFFARGKFRARGWTLFYIHTLLQPAVKPLLLLPAAEVERFFSEINAKFQLHLGFPHTREEPGFLLSFVEAGSPRPRYLGRMTAEEELHMMENKIPAPNFTEFGDDAIDPRSFAAFRAKMEAAIQAGKNKSKATKLKKRGERIVLKKGWCAELKRARCYLGLRPKWVQLENPHDIPNLTWDELQAAEAKDEMTRIARLQDIDVTKPVPNPFDRDVVFVSIDVECYERSHKQITEIGISTLDTRDLADLPPGQGGIAWMNKIRARHFRIKEHSHLENKDFVVGCADRFEKQFGQSEWISIKEAPQVVASCFRHPFSAQISVAPSTETGENSTSNLTEFNGTSELPSHSATNDDATRRSIILVGHDVKQDIDYLRSIGYDLGNLSNVLEAVDTSDIFRALKHERQSRNLGAILLELGLVGWNLHNAGNDAAYTLQALIGICFQSQDNKSNRLAEIEKERADRLEEAAMEVKQQIIQDGEEWNLADNDEGDGGSPPGLIASDPASTNGTSKINRVERVAKEKLEAKKQNKREMAAVVGFAHQDRYNAKPVDGGTSFTKGFVNPNSQGVAMSKHHYTSNFADQGIPNSTTRIKDSIDQEITNQAIEKTTVLGPEPDNTDQNAANEGNHAEPTKSGGKENTPEIMDSYPKDKDDAPISARTLDRLGFLESMDAEDDGGVKL